MRRRRRPQGFDIHSRARRFRCHGKRAQACRNSDSPYKPIGEFNMSFKPEVFVQGSWSTNALRFETETEAYRYAVDLAMRWTLVADFRATGCADPVTAKLVDDELVML